MLRRGAALGCGHEPPRGSDPEAVLGARCAGRPWHGPSRARSPELTRNSPSLSWRWTDHPDTRGWDGAVTGPEGLATAPVVHKVSSGARRGGEPVPDAVLAHQVDD